jgi:hypothetical protein
MSKLYAVKLKKTPSQAIKGRFIDMGHYTARSLSQLINLIAEKGIGCVETIRHDDKTPRNTRQLNRNEMLEMWKAFERKK